MRHEMARARAPLRAPLAPLLELGRVGELRHLRLLARRQPRRHGPDDGQRRDAQPMQRLTDTIKFGIFFYGFAPGEEEEAAANLFTMIRYLDKNKSKNIMVAPIPNDGIGIAINDRLERAAQ